ncbi:MAG: PEP-CTERM sorting domain-containing protein, partial [Synechocystis sp.]|nr:PEP-CTERM sorting domain-containing protein [Synechocystis sp.]
IPSAMKLQHSLVLLAAMAAPFVSSAASATLAPNIVVDGLLLGEPNITGVTTTMGTGAGDLNNLINQSNFNPQYTSLSTDFDSFLNSATTNANPGTNGWRSSAPDKTGFLSFTLDKPYFITGIGLWLANAAASNIDNQVQEFSVFADSDANPLNGAGTLMGTFTAQQLSTGNPFVGQAWGLPSDNWTAKTTQFIQLRIDSNYGGDTTSLGEVAFATDVVPEPMTLLGASAAAGLGAFFKRRQQKSTKS